MSWITGDWQPWPLEGGMAGELRFEPGQLSNLLLRIPGHHRMTLASLDGESLGGLDGLVQHYGRVLALEPEHFNAEPAEPAEPAESMARGKERFDVVTALQSMPTRDRDELDRLLRSVRASLFEGGVLLAAFPAATRIGGPVQLRLGTAGRSGSATLHEVELQFRMNFAGFQGVRIQRFVGGGAGGRCGQANDSSGTLLCMATRRAFN